MSDPVQSATDQPGETDGRHVRAYIDRVRDMVEGSKARLTEAGVQLDKVRSRVHNAMADVPVLLQNALDALQADLDAARASLELPAPPQPPEQS